MANAIFNKNQWVVGTLVVTDNMGNNAPHEPGSVQAESSNPESFIVEPFGDEELNRKIIGIAPGTGVVNFSVRNLNGQTLSGTAEVEVTPALAVNVSMQFSQPIQQ